MLKYLIVCFIFVVLLILLIFSFVCTRCCLPQRGVTTHGTPTSLQQDSDDDIFQHIIIDLFSTMFSVIEFSEEDGGGVSVIRQEWLTPRKQHSMWPPHKINSKFNKCINGYIACDETWKMYRVKRIFYETDSLVKAREKAKQAEIDSEINSDDGAVRKPRRKKKNYESDDSSEDNIGDNLSFICPTPPATQIEGNSIVPTLSDKEQEALPKIQPTPNTSIVGSEASIPDISSLDLTITPFINDVVPNSHALDVIAKHLANIESQMRDLQESQNEIISRLRSSSTVCTGASATLPGDLIPCNDRAALDNLEAWISTEENKAILINYLSLVGGTKPAAIIRRILEKLFTNTLALTCNWTGKNNKIAIKDFPLLVAVIKEAVRRNKIAELVTDNDIHNITTNWFRFTKDRDGGRESRRNPSQ